MSELAIFIAGVIVGWLTKIPFLIKWYREHKRDKKHIEDIINRFNK